MQSLHGSVRWRFSEDEERTPHNSNCITSSKIFYTIHFYSMGPNKVLRSWVLNVGKKGYKHSPCNYWLGRSVSQVLCSVRQFLIHTKLLIFHGSHYPPVNTKSIIQYYMGKFYINLVNYCYHFTPHALLCESVCSCGHDRMLYSSLLSNPTTCYVWLIVAVVLGSTPIGFAFCVTLSPLEMKSIMKWPWHASLYINNSLSLLLYLLCPPYVFTLCCRLFAVL